MLCFPFRPRIGIAYRVTVSPLQTDPAATWYIGGQTIEAIKKMNPNATVVAGVYEKSKKYDRFFERWFHVIPGNSKKEI
jgi:hypothetical protein